MNRAFASRRYFLLLNQHFKNYYEALGVSPKATQADIKTAYYKLSMMYHPDHNQGCKESAARFQSIKSAYEVLSDYKSRKLYDRGLLVDKEDSTFSGLGKSSSIITHKTRPVMTGRSPIYDYDAWSRAHYGDIFARKVEAKERMETIKRTDHIYKQTNMAQTIAFGIVFLMGFAVFCSVSNETNELTTKNTSYKKATN